jgi:hypothetical protein
MKRMVLLFVVASIASAFCSPAAAQARRDRLQSETTEAEPPEDVEEIIVRGKRIGELRLEIQRAEEALFARFNEINSTDDFDIHCRAEKVYGLLRRACMSNSWREQDGHMAGELVKAMRGQGDGSTALVYRREQLRMQRLLSDEMRQLTLEDKALRDAMSDLSEAQLALALRAGNKTLFRQVTAASGTLPYGATLMFEVIMGNDPWDHFLTQRTFTIANVFGEIRRMEIQCVEDGQRIDYETALDWTVPDGWNSCILLIKASKGATFTLYEF